MLPPCIQSLTCIGTRAGVARAKRSVVLLSPMVLNSRLPRQVHFTTTGSQHGMSAQSGNLKQSRSQQVLCDAFNRARRSTHSQIMIETSACLLVNCLLHCAVPSSELTAHTWATMSLLGYKDAGPCRLEASGSSGVGV